MLSERIYYVDKNLNKIIESHFELVGSALWVELYRDKTNGSLWRLDTWDKFQQQYFVRVDKESWKDFDSRELQIELLKTTRGVTSEKCKWQGCNKNALAGIVFCERHAFEMGIRR
jgi:hypothetical protein